MYHDTCIKWRESGLNLCSDYDFSFVFELWGNDGVLLHMDHYRQPSWNCCCQLATRQTDTLDIYDMCQHGYL